VKRWIVNRHRTPPHQISQCPLLTVVAAAFGAKRAEQVGRIMHPFLTQSPKYQKCNK